MTQQESSTNTARAIPIRNRDGIVHAYAIVDEDRWGEFMAYRWSLHGGGYATRTVYTKGSRHTRAVFLHREIFALVEGDGLVVDHINGDRLDNRTSNLRVVTPAQNCQNIMRTKGASKYRGVFLASARSRKAGKPWQAGVDINGKTRYLGTYADETEAARVASEYRAKHMPYSVDAQR